MRSFYYVLSFAAFVLIAACSTSPEKTEVYQEPYRPQYHFSPDSMWMNDPNGLVYDGEQYHLFYQYHPNDIVWGPMHWGHATSKDMVKWEHQPIALFPDEHGTIFSGSAVMDLNNTSGLGTPETPPMIAIFTYHDAEAAERKEADFQTQGMAYSLDKGVTWTKYADNPVIDNPGYIDFRDPKIFWHEASASWILALVAGDHLQLYRSDNLIDWKLSSTFGHEVGAHGGVWECPDLFALEVNGETHWVLLISINPGGPNGGSATQYFIGDFDGETFSSDQTAIRWVDYGPDNYAGVTYNNTPDDSRLFIGWMSNWQYAQNTPTQRWRSASTLPRTLHLKEVDGEIVLQNTPIEALEQLKIPQQVDFESVSMAKALDLPSDQAHIRLRLEASVAEFEIRSQKSEKISLQVDRSKGHLIIDRSQSGRTDFSEAFSEPIVIDYLESSSDEMILDLWLDRSSLEVFVNDGMASATVIYFSEEPMHSLHSNDFGKGLSIQEVSEIDRIW